jgi:uncharacterized protein
MAVGLFVALLPVMGVQMPLAVVLAEVIRRTTGLRLSRIAAAAGVWVTNPLTFAPIYAAAYLTGLPFTRILMPTPDEDPTRAVAELTGSRPAALEFILPLVIGGVILGLLLASVGYLATHSLVARYQARRALRKARAGEGPASLVALRGD